MSGNIHPASLRRPDGEEVFYLAPEGRLIVTASQYCPIGLFDDDLPPVALRVRREGESYPYPDLQGFRSGETVEVVSRLQPDGFDPLPRPVRVECYLRPGAVPTTWDPARKASIISLSGGDLIATGDDTAIPPASIEKGRVYATKPVGGCELRQLSFAVDFIKSESSDYPVYPYLGLARHGGPDDWQYQADYEPAIPAISYFSHADTVGAYPLRITQVVGGTELVLHNGTATDGQSSGSLRIDIDLDAGIVWYYFNGEMVYEYPLPEPLTGDEYPVGTPYNVAMAADFSGWR